MKGLAKKFWIFLIISGVLTMTARSLMAQAHELKVQYYGGVMHSLTWYVAIGERLFEKNGLKIVPVSMTSGPAAVAALSSDSVDLAVGNPDTMMTGLQGGLDLQVICGGSGSFWEMLANPDIPKRPYPELMKAFEGKRVGVNAVGASGQFFVEALLAEAGMRKDAVEFVGVGTLTAVDAMKKNRIDAYMSFEPVTVLIEKTTDARVVLNLGQGEGPPLLSKLRIGFVWFAKRAYLDKRPEAYRAFSRSLQEARIFSANPDNREKVVEDVIRGAAVDTKHLPGGDDTLRQVVRDKLLKTHNVTKVTSEELAAWLTFMQKYTPKVLKGEYATRNPAELMKDKIWKYCCE
jgi:ABC-type nitrate/sulfonate/bicarbonate transport system substrate-binding protein